MASCTGHIVVLMLLLLPGGSEGLVVSPGRARAQQLARSGKLPAAMAAKGGGKDKKFGGKQQQGKKGGPPSASSRDAAFEEKTKSFIFTILGLTKNLPDGSRFRAMGWQGMTG